jgi:4'-phosphopantetheinyl transferase
MTVHPSSSWLPAPAGLALPRDEMHIWRASLDLPRQQVQALLQTLAPDEVERAQRFRFAEDSDRFIVARGLLRAILGRYLHVPPEELRFCSGSCGKPALAIQFEGSGIQFNLSYSHSLALYAVTRDRRVGIDLEYVRPIPDARQIVERFFSPKERSILSALPPDEQLETFFRCWTGKEAYLKATGEGLSFPLDQVDVALAPGEAQMQLAVSGDPSEAAHWSLTELCPGPGYAAALAVEGHSWQLSCWQWQW